MLSVGSARSRAIARLRVIQRVAGVVPKGGFRRAQDGVWVLDGLEHDGDVAEDGVEIERGRERRYFRTTGAGAAALAAETEPLASDVRSLEPVCAAPGSRSRTHDDLRARCRSCRSCPARLPRGRGAMTWSRR